jgi:hypothetical protein
MLLLYSISLNTHDTSRTHPAPDESCSMLATCLKFDNLSAQELMTFTTGAVLGRESYLRSVIREVRLDFKIFEVLTSCWQVCSVLELCLVLVGALRGEMKSCALLSKATEVLRRCDILELFWRTNLMRLASLDTFLTADKIRLLLRCTVAMSKRSPIIQAIVEFKWHVCIFKYK